MHRFGFVALVHPGIGSKSWTTTRCWRLMGYWISTVVWWLVTFHGIRSQLVDAALLGVAVQALAVSQWVHQEVVIFAPLVLGHTLYTLHTNRLSLAESSWKFWSQLGFPWYLMSANKCPIDLYDVSACRNMVFIKLMYTLKYKKKILVH